MTELNQKIEEIMTKFSDFTDGFRLLMLTHRSKEGGANRDRKQIKRISKNRDEFREILKDLLEIKLERKEIPYRIYSCVNARDANKAIRIFKQDQLNADYYDPDSKNLFYLDIKNRFISCLMRHQSRAETKFLIDIDESEGDDFQSIHQEVVNAIGPESIFEYKTKNGYHIITKPFNPNLVNCEVNKDGLLLLAY